MERKLKRRNGHGLNPWLHFGINLAVTTAVVIAYVGLRVHEDLAVGAPARLHPVAG